MLLTNVFTEDSNERKINHTGMSMPQNVAANVMHATKSFSSYDCRVRFVLLWFTVNSISAIQCGHYSCPGSLDCDRQPGHALHGHKLDKVSWKFLLLMNL